MHGIYLALIISMCAVKPPTLRCLRILLNLYLLAHNHCNNLGSGTVEKAVPSCVNDLVDDLGCFNVSVPSPTSVQSNLMIM